MTTRSDNPDWYEVVQALLEDHSLELHTAFPARVQRYYPAEQTADLVPLIRHPVPQPDGSVTYEDLPVLPRVPVLFQRTARFFVALPLSPGDTMLVVCQEAAAGHWEAGAGDAQYPGDLRRHHLAHAVALLGYTPVAKALTHAPADMGGLTFGDDEDEGTRVVILPDGTLTVTRGSTVVVQVDPDGTVHIGGNTATNFVALANLVNDRLAAIASKFDAHTHVETGGTTDAPVLAQRIGSLASVAATKAKAK